MSVLHYSDGTCRDAWEQHFSGEWLDDDNNENGWVWMDEPVRVRQCWWTVLNVDGQPRHVVLAVIDGPADPDVVGDVTIEITDENAAPPHYCCPVEVLNRAPEPAAGSAAATWRARVRAAAKGGS